MNRPIFEPGQPVTVDGDSFLIGRVTGVLYRSSDAGTWDRTEYEVSWFSNGSINAAWIAAWRLNKAL